MANKKQVNKNEIKSETTKKKQSSKVSQNNKPKQNKKDNKNISKNSTNNKVVKNSNNNKNGKTVKENNQNRKNNNKNSNVSQTKNKIQNKKIEQETKAGEIKEEKVSKFIIKDNFTINLIIVTLAFFTTELLFKCLSHFEIIDYSTIRILISSFILAIIITFLSSLTKRRWIRNSVNITFIFLYTLYSWLQIGFINYLGVYISFNTSSQFGAVRDYIFEFLASYKFIYFIVFLPFIFILIWYLIIIRKKEYHKFHFKLNTLYLIPLIILCCLLYYGSIVIPFMQNKLQIKSNKELFISPDVPTVTVNQFGTTVFGILDLKSYIFPVVVEAAIYEKEETEEAVVNRKVSKALDSIAEKETNKKYMSLNNYFSSQAVTDFNDYTGIFEGKNVVVILMESVNDAFINEEYFPNFYNLYSNGWHWENSYSPRNSCATGNNEFSALTGLYSIYNTCTANVYKNNTYFESIFNLFNDKGYNTTSMHDFNEWYYYRSTIHKNMGSGKYYGAGDLNIKTSYYGEWPSDIEFFEKAFDIILNDESEAPWMTWLTTVTSHQPYSNSSTYGDLYKNDFKKLGYSTAVSRYLSKLKVLDEAIGVMMEKLESSGELDNTVIVMLADHYPYGLSKTYIKEMLNYNLNDYDIEKTPFVIYNSEIEPKVFTEYTSYINLVPTLANLMNLNYDPRLYMGDDLLSEDYESLVVFADGSWKNEIAFYNASTSKIKYYTDKEYTSEEIKEINTTVNLKISMSSSAIKNNYFKYLEEKIDEYNEENKILEETILNEIIDITTSDK